MEKILRRSNNSFEEIFEGLMEGVEIVDKTEISSEELFEVEKLVKQNLGDGPVSAPEVILIIKRTWASVSKKVISATAIALLLASVVTSKAVATKSEVASSPKYGHPEYVWSDSGVLLDVVYRPGVGYTYEEIEVAFFAIATTACGGEDEADCWHGRHVGILRNIYTKEVSGFYMAPNGMYYLIDTGECLSKDGCEE